MHRWVVILKDCPEGDASRIRMEKFSDHFRFLQANFHRIIFSCGLNKTSGEGESLYGGFWIVEADNEHDVRKLINDDPYFGLGLRESIEIFRAHEGYV